MSQPTAISDIRRDLVALLPRLRRFALTLAASAPEADDLVREVCNRAIQKSHHWKGEGRIESWLFSMMRSTCADARKKRKSEAAIDTARGTASIEAEKQSNPILSMPEGLASAFLLGEVEGFNYKEASAILGIPRDLFASRLCAARLRLAALGVETAERRA
ncbi:RNA polymerase sigma factor [Neorhizobium lilium]|uniref:RNA polymerase sigma factor n=1 Tax=Neorhizobium lilium TaxID=2503024 RepID=A0A444LI15_9HYPH|nr:RNA polymerase sigma factor [Neorhizobium lilium]RWX78663.1 RNA polymerase sigma factor [Neorhizobium lilium]